MPWPKGRPTANPPFCPGCKSRDVTPTGGTGRTTQNRPGQEAYCGDCGHRWISVHRDLTAAPREEVARV